MSKILHLELDTIINGEVLDRSGNGHNGTVNGGVTTVTDTTFGTCLDFNGTDGYIRLDKDVVSPVLKAHSFTVTAWVYLDSTSGDQTILGDFSNGSTNDAIHLIIRDGIPHLGFYDNDLVHSTLLNPGEWYHLSFVYDYDAVSQTGTQRIYIDGADMAEEANKAPLENCSELDLGRWHPDARFLDGKLYGFRLYDTALPQSDIQSVMTEDQSSPAFRSTYPIDFDLYDKEVQNVLYIEDTSDQTLTLHIKNASTQNIVLNDLTEPVSNSNYHFALRFRPGTLSQTTLEGTPNGIQLATETAASWEMATPETDADGMDVIYLKSTTIGLSMASEDTQTIIFEKVGADAGQGSRGTRVELLYQNMAFSSTPYEDLNSKRELHLNVINHRGKQNFPLHVGFVGDNGVLNDGSTSNLLQLRFSNTLAHDATSPDLSQLSFAQDDDETVRSKIILSFDVGTAAEEEWALGNSGNIAAIDIEQPEGITGWFIDKNTTGGNTEWTLYPNTEDQILYGINEPNGNPEYFDLLIKDIASGFPTGHTHLHIQYENIPGYWDGQMKVAIEKRPLVYDSGNVGVGTIAPTEKLEVAGVTSSQGLRIPGLYNFGQANSAIEIEVANGGYNAIRGYNGSQGIGTIHFFDDTWQSGNLGKSAGAINISGKEGVTIGGWSNPIARFIGNTGESNNDGSVGIGTTAPAAKLDVAGAIRCNGDATSGTILFGNTNESGTPDGDGYRIRYDTSYFGTNEDALIFEKTDHNGTDPDGGIAFVNTGDDGTVANALVIRGSGNVGIGTTDPDTPLAIRGNGGGRNVGITQNHIGGIASMEFTTVDDSDNQATRLMLRGNSDTPNIEFYRGAKDSEAMSMIIDGSSGNVGIGTTNPSERLDVSGNVKVSGKIEPSAGNGSSNGIIFPANPGGGSGDVASIQYYATSGEETVLELKVANDSTDHIALMPSGNAGIGTTDPQDKLDVKGSIRISTAASNTYAVLHYDNQNNYADNDLGSGTAFIIEVNNAKNNSNEQRIAAFNGDSNWDFDSDRRLKMNIDNEKDILSRLLQLDVKNYHWKDNPDSKLKSIGFIAQDVQPLFPVLVGKAPKREGEAEATLTLKNGAFGILAVGALKELKQQTDAIIARQDQRIKDLESRLAALEAKLG